MLKKIVSLFICFATALTLTVSSFAMSDGVQVGAAESVPLYLKYYYDQMSSDSKAFFLKLRKAILNCEPKVKFTISEMRNTDKDEMVSAFSLLDSYDPLAFNFILGDLTVDSSSPDTFLLNYHYDKSTYNKMAAAYEDKVNEILEKIPDDMSVYKKIKTIHDEIINAASYDGSAYEAHQLSGDNDNDNSVNIYGTLVEGKAVCEGYSETFAYICSKIGVRAVCVRGDEYPSKDDTPHEWNKVYYNKQWYNVDVTWDDPVSNYKENLKYDYFMISDKQMQRDHRENNPNFKVPKAADDFKAYYTVNKKCAEDTDSVKKIIRNGIASAAKNNSTAFTFQCSSKSVYNKVKKYLDGQDILDVLGSVKKKTNKNLVDAEFKYSVNDKQYTITIILFYRDTSLDKYYNDPGKVSKNTKNSLKKYGIK